MYSRLSRDIADCITLNASYCPVSSCCADEQAVIPY